MQRAVGWTSAAPASVHCNPFISSQDSNLRQKFSALTRVLIPAERDVQLAALFGEPAVPAHGSRRTAVFVHGFASEKTESGLFPPIAAALRARGVAVLLYDWRGLGESDGTFGSTHLRTHVWDFHRVLDWLASNYGTYPREVCGIGFSLGATVIVAAGAAEVDTRVGAGVFLSPALRPSRDMWPRYAKLAQQLTPGSYVLKPDSSVQLGLPILESLRDTDVGRPGLNLGFPVLVCHGTSDARIPVSSTLAAVSSARSDIVSLSLYDGASHSFRPEGVHRPRLVAEICDWIAPTASTTLRVAHSALGAGVLPQIF